jgi:NhaP-type Na+/H+ or K+/H+ antiporter
MAVAVTYVALCLFVYALVEKRLSTTPITGPMVFVGFGILASSQVFGIIEISGGVTTVVDILFQATLVLVLFTDASTLTFSSWRNDTDYPARLLGVGLPLTIAAGAAFAALLFTDLSIWEAAIIGAIIAPTDAALGQAVVSNPRVPERIRQALDIESGLNDGISLPFVLIFIGLAEQAEDVSAIGTFVAAIGVAAVVGGTVGLGGGWALVRSTSAGWISTGWSGLAVLSVAGFAFVVADEGGGSGFIAAFVAGLAYGHVTRGKIAPNEFLAGTLGLWLIQISFLAFGALIVVEAFERLTWQFALMAILALTVARMVPVAISMIGTRLSMPTLLYMGWFGPRGLATIVFAALVVTGADLAGQETIVTVAAITVAASVLLHGLTSFPGSEAYGDWFEQQDKEGLEEAKEVHHHVQPHVHLLSRRARTASESAARTNSPER